MNAKFTDSQLKMHQMRSTNDIFYKKDLHKSGLAAENISAKDNVYINIIYINK